MSEPTPYEKLGVNDEASFEEVRDARDRLLREHEGDESQQEAIELAYDAILMDRLRARKEGKIAVPDRIRYPERLSTAIPAALQNNAQRRAPSWLSKLLDTPKQKDIYISLGVFAGLGAVSFFVSAATTWLSFGLIASVYLLTRKENRFGRALLISLSGITIGVLLAALTNQVLVLSRLVGDGFFPSSIQMVIILLVMWLHACFLK
ncbi:MULTISPECIES: CPP1-like family protein [Pseudanabaena]|uniref:Heat shock protein DnaJ domain protein n=2 Tax=Pseudanabaena TaxID=1152 RepID=L8N3W5_9CYAN|nr:MULTISPECIES: CPP1-like family protein [Pseudanabaena]ELS33415.1 heat shock protein DnaJ domain protein [Pseudanabaena biceps PCC 7429]MDG3494353.1 CPP1-like family protein [Pseudanabaena catenata USMAC16]